MDSRPLKFRAWDEKLKKMFVPSHIDGHGILVTDEQHDEGCACTPHRKGTHPIEYPNPYTLMQFTGLHDKNGKEMYEGDALRHLNGTVGVVEFDRAHFTVAERRRDGRKIWNAIDDEGWEIIGNIYSTPELLANPNKA